MPPSSVAASYSDAALLLAAQAGERQAQNEVPNRFTPLIMSMIRSARPGKRLEFREDVQGEVFRMIFDPTVARFVAARGTPTTYLFGVVKNAIRIIDRQRRPAFVNGLVKPVGDDVPVSGRDAGVVFDNTFRWRATPTSQEDLAVREQVEVVFHNEDAETVTVARLRFVEGLPVTAVARSVGSNRFAVARRLDRFCREASRRLALAGAA